MLAMLVLGACRDDPPPPPLRYATFNIEDFPKSQQQIIGAFAEIAKTKATFVGLQEIGEPALFAREMRGRLGPDWELAALDTRPVTARPTHHLAVAFDRRVWMLAGTTTHDDTRLVEGRWKPTFEVRLRSRTKGRSIEVAVLVVHLKAGGDAREIRARQYPALRAIIQRVRKATPNVIVLGDFNATDDRGDREDLARLAKATGLRWATEKLRCSAFWDRDDGCWRSRLDHVLTWTAPRKITAGGACATDGCKTSNACPKYVGEVSDHCPVAVEQ